MNETTDEETTPVMGLLVYIYRNPLFVGCSQDGVSERCTKATVVEFDGRPVVGGCSTPTSDAPAVKIVVRWKGSPNEYMHAEPLERGEGAGPMMGGSFIHSSDSRFRALATYPVPLHDRWEPRR
jgi:hypothetical protein